jgi:tRNA threonylcarbamoyladenosine biosynthesis protein TsaE
MLDMNTDMTLEIASNNLNDTQAVGEAVGKNLKGGEVIELTSDLGGGKTALVRGIASGLGSTDHVASPTFTISRVYQAGGLILQHFDFYRLDDPGIMVDELAETIGDPKTIVAIEWAATVQAVLPEQRLRVHIETTGEHSRHITINAPESMHYCLEGLV